MMKNYFSFILKTPFVLKIFKFLPKFLGHVGKQFAEKAKVNFKVYDAINWKTNNWNTHIAQYLNKLIQSENELCSVSRI